MFGAAPSAANVLFLFVLLATLGLAIWAAIDVARQPSDVVSTGAKTGWLIGIIGGTLIFGIIGLVVTLVYLLVFRRRYQERASS